MIVLSNVRKLYDGTSADPGSIHESVDVLVEGERIKAIEPHRPDREHAEDDVLVDASRYTVTPGLIDCHGHITILGLASSDTLKMNEPSALLLIEKQTQTAEVVITGGKGHTKSRDRGQHQPQGQQC